MKSKLSLRQALLVTAAAFGAVGFAAVPDSSAYAQEAQRTYNIRAQSLDTALREFGLQSGRDVLYAPAIVAGRRSPGARGSLTEGQALDAVLAGSGLRFQRTTSGGYAIQAIAGPLDEDGVPASDEAVELEAITVTGTRIRGKQPVGSPAITLTSEDLERTGHSTLQDALRTIPQFGPGVGLLNGNAESRNVNYATGLDLRGLGIGTTLVLVDGRRQPVSGVRGNFVDISTIPLSAVERVDILLDGASAIYGSDAIGGVVNIILKKNYRGAETLAHYGTYGSEADEFRLSQTVGLTWEGGNLLLGMERFERSELSASERPFSANADQRRRGGSDWRRGFGASPGTIYDGDTFEPFRLPAGQDGTGLTPADLLPGENLGNQNIYQALLPAETTTSLFSSISQSVHSRLTLNADTRYSEREIESIYGGVELFVFVPSSNPFYVDPIAGGDGVYFQGMLMSAQPPRQNGYTRSFRFGLGGDLALDGDWVVRGSAAYNTEQSRLIFGQVDEVALAEALADPDPNTALNLFGDTFQQNPQTV